MKMEIGIAGLSKDVNAQLKLIPFIKAYFEAIASTHPDVLQKGALDALLDPINDLKLREAIRHIGFTNELPRLADLKKLKNPVFDEQYRRNVEFGLAALRYLQRTIKAEFMPDTSDAERSIIGYRRQIAVVCKGCDEYKLSGMFEFSEKDRSHTNDITFKQEHIIDPTTTELQSHGKKGTKQWLICKPCDRVEKKDFELRYEGAYASAREFFYSQKMIDRLIREGKHPRVREMRIRVKEAASESEKLTYKATVENGDSAYFQTLQNSKTDLEKIMGEDVSNLLTDNVLYDKFGGRILTNTDEDCYWFQEWFSQSSDIKRVHDYIAHPKENGYSALHFTLWNTPRYGGGVDIPIDMQVTTYDRYKVNEGVAKRSELKDRENNVNHKLLLAIIAIRHNIVGM